MFFKTKSIFADLDAERAIARRDMNVRFAQLDETLTLARYSTSVPILVAMVLLAFFWKTPQRVAMEWVSGLVVFSGTAAITTALLFRSRIASRRSIALGHAVAGLFALLMGCAWGAMPVLLLSGTNPDHQLIVVATTAGVVANVYALGPIRQLGWLYATPIFAGAALALALGDASSNPPLAALLVIYAGFLYFTTHLLNDVTLQRMNDRARVREQDDTIGLLMRDSEGNGSDWLFELDAGGRLRGASERLAAVTRLPRATLEGAPFRKIFTGHMTGTPTTAGMQTVLDAITQRRAFHEIVTEIKTADGSLWWQLTGKPLHDKLGAFTGYRGVGFDVTAARIAEARIAYLASFDTLTGVANRDSLQTEIAKACADAATDSVSRALLYLDLDGFKTVNDTFGHGVGDALLREAAKRLSAVVPQNAIIGRLGGDEFAVLCHVADAAGAQKLAHTIVEALGVPFSLESIEVMVGASVGIAVTPLHGVEADALLVKADLALYRAKADGKGRHRLFVEAYEQSLIEKRLLEDDLKLALARREFSLHYQPLIDLGTGQVVSFEALIRWHSPTRGAVSPAVFIPAAESTGLVVAIGRWVLAEACGEAARWNPGITVAVNISPQHFRSADFVQDVVAILARSGLHAARLEIEITEGVFLEQSSAAIANLHALRRRGVKIALDDFGTGFSSLNYLVNFPVDKIKIDQTFVRDIVVRHESRAIVEAILTLAKKLAIAVTAEGVETVEQALALKLRRCDTIQGYLMSKPRPASDIDAMIAEVPRLFQSMIPMLFDSPLALALAMRKQIEIEQTVPANAANS